MGHRDTAYPPIHEYAIIGDCSSAALIAKDGSIDWLCWPWFDSPSLFAALLDRRRGGCFYIRPCQPYTVTRQYVGPTNVLETTFATETGVLRLTDLMTVTSSPITESRLRSTHELLRALMCEEGTVDVELLFDPNYDYGRFKPRLEDRGPLGYFCNHKSEVLVLRSEIPLTLADDASCLRATATLQAGERRYLAMAYNIEEPAVLPLLGAHAARRIDQTLAYWRGWAGRCTYEGLFHEAVLRSILTLKLMTFSRSGAVVAAPTTSLPEAIGGERNWDYRYCWLRDAAVTLRALFELGYWEEGDSFFHWLLNATGGMRRRLQVLYDIFGNVHTPERELDHLEGYRGSRPVRIGNAAKDQFQLDIYGEVVIAAFESIKEDERLTRGQARLLCKIGHTICNRWQDPDHGIWEVRSARRHHTYSKVMCWVALDRLLQLHESGHLDVPADHFRTVREEIRQAIEQVGYNNDLNSYVSTFGGDTVDASLLLLALYGYTEPTAPRMQATFRLIHERLGHGSLLYRYSARTDDGLSSREGAFGLCSFWGVEYLARCKRLDEAYATFETLLGYANDVGLYAEEIDPETGAALGNFPQAFTHVGLINAALTLAEAEGRREKSSVEQELKKQED